MRYTADQNPSNRVGRNSGAGPGGISRVTPTAAERARGLEPIDLDARPAGGWKGVGIGLGAVALIGAGIAAAALQSRRRYRRSWRGRLQGIVGWIS
jgi:hypothetical protein